LCYSEPQQGRVNDTIYSHNTITGAQVRAVTHAKQLAHHYQGVCSAGGKYVKVRPD